MKIIVTKKGEHYRISVFNCAGRDIELDDKAHTGITQKAEAQARSDVIRVAFALPSESVVWKCDAVPALAR